MYRGDSCLRVPERSYGRGCDRSVVRGEPQAGGTLPIPRLRPRQARRPLAADGAHPAGRHLWRCHGRVLQQTQDAR